MRYRKETVADMDRMVLRRINEWKKESLRMQKRFGEIGGPRSRDMVVRSIDLALRAMFGLRIH